MEWIWQITNSYYTHTMASATNDLLFFCPSISLIRNRFDSNKLQPISILFLWRKKIHWIPDRVFIVFFFFFRCRYKSSVNCKNVYQKKEEQKITKLENWSKNASKIGWKKTRRTEQITLSNWEMKSIDLCGSRRNNTWRKISQMLEI